MDNTRLPDSLDYATPIDRPLRLQRKTVVRLSLLAIAIFMVVSIFTPFGPNFGLPVGYYGKLNRIKSRVDKLPGVKVVGVRGNYDITLEEFSIDVLVHGKHRDSLYFPERPMQQLLPIIEKWRTNVLPTYREP